MAASSHRKLLPTIRPSLSATTEYTSGRDNSDEKRLHATSDEGKSGGKLCCPEIVLNAS
ncbi:hypothetical protein [Nitrosospira multiformis]|uniref:hypothetical protein n=1 Tax=Nitrosospira multiformis TaxID=1231 RepID=UPI00210AB506|nr:hypothetical protein [Nitrosospira multiformis]